MDAETLFAEEYDQQEKKVLAASSNIVNRFDDEKLVIETLKRMDINRVNAFGKSG